MTAYHPGSELVAQAWLATVPGITAAMVASTLPAAAVWASTGFIVTTTAGGTPGLDIPSRSPLIQLDCYAVKAGSQRPPWRAADQLAQTVIAGCFQAGRQTRDVTVKAGYAPARLYAVWPTMEPQPLYDDDSSRARYRLDIRIDWMELAVT